MDDADADFITIMAPDRTRWTHPRDEELGKPYIGSIDAALNGQVFTEITAGTLGPVGPHHRTRSRMRPET